MLIIRNICSNTCACAAINKFYSRTPKSSRLSGLLLTVHAVRITCNPALPSPSRRCDRRQGTRKKKIRQVHRVKIGSRARGRRREKGETREGKTREREKGRKRGITAGGDDAVDKEKRRTRGKRKKDRSRG